MWKCQAAHLVDLVVEDRGFWWKVSHDWQAFVRIVGANVSAMEEQVNQAEGEQGSLPGAFKKIFRTMNVSAFLNVSISQAQHCSRKCSHADVRGVKLCGQVGRHANYTV